MLKVIQGGFLNTVQDLGRIGFKHFGVSQAGVLDKPALLIANDLVNNLDSAAVLEITLGPIEIEFCDSRYVALTGADFDAKLDGISCHPGWLFHVKQGQRLKLTRPKKGARAYLAIEGGIVVEQIMESASTDINGEFGGFKGRPLRSGDELALGPCNKASMKRAIGVSLPKLDNCIRFLPGPEFTNLSQASQDSLINEIWTLSRSVSRMGVRVHSRHKLEFTEQNELGSHAVMPGTIQLPDGGEPIILLADAQTTGGYPRVGQVIQGDMHKLAQLKPKDEIKLVLVSFEQAALVNNQLTAYINQIKIGLASVREKREQDKNKQREKATNTNSLTLNADVGEGSLYDTELIKLISHANIACGAHAGDDRIMADTIAAAKKYNASIGAHPSYPDRENFGRKPMKMSTQALYNSLYSQVSLLGSHCHQQNTIIDYIKPHGALYNLAAEDKTTALVLIDVIQALKSDAKSAKILGINPEMKFMMLADSSCCQWAENAGITVIYEAFADRRYTLSESGKGMLSPRSQQGAVIEDLEDVLEQVNRLNSRQPVITINEESVLIEADSLCIHGDNQHALTFATAIAEEVK